VRFLVPATAVSLALLGAKRGRGLFNNLALPGWAALAGSVVLLDLAIYLQHVMFHAVPALWRVHRMDHADLDFDVTTGVRFHPIEIILSTLIKLGVVGALGASPPGVFTATSIFNHSNVRLTGGLDGFL
jgi:sterol desaturase/sphingolipid hydroxylase (fatty acid hydroxylase superfamily)